MPLPLFPAPLKDEYDQIIGPEGAPHRQAFDYGGGHVNCNKARDPGLTYDMGISDYVCFFCATAYNNSANNSMTKAHTICFKSTRFVVHLHLLSITILELTKSLTVSRIVTNYRQGMLWVTKERDFNHERVRVQIPSNNISILNFSGGLTQVKLPPYTLIRKSALGKCHWLYHVSLIV